MPMVCSVIYMIQIQAMYERVQCLDCHLRRTLHPCLQHILAENLSNSEALILTILLTLTIFDHQNSGSFRKREKEAARVFYVPNPMTGISTVVSFAGFASSVPATSPMVPGDQRSSSGLCPSVGCGSSQCRCCMK